MFLTEEEVAALTGYQLPAWQRRWLDRNGWKYSAAASGRPIVAREYASRRLCGDETLTEPEPVLHFESLKKRA